jgi:hypothetical protein
MTKRSARKLVRETADQLYAAHEPGLGPAVAERAYGIAQRKLADEGVDLTMDERLQLLAYAHGYAEALTGAKEPRGHDLDAHKDAHAAGMQAAK